MLIKAQDFWAHICGVLEYRFFAGVPCTGLDPLYDKMSPDFMHYIPAVNEHVAVGLVNGAFLAGLNSAALMDANVIANLDLKFNLEQSFPLLIIASSKEKPSFRKELYSLDLTEDLSIIDKISKHIASKRKPGVLFIGEGTLV